MIADDPGNKIALKAFHCEILNEIPAIQKEEAAYKTNICYQKGRSYYGRAKAPSDMEQINRMEAAATYFQ